jgi:glyoxylase-like metal-dependent hydrolase (beta-lactamase superfamily II)
MILLKIETPKFKIDGGAYFGVIPKTIWQNHYPADSENMCEVSCRSLLIDDGNKVFLIDTGIGDKLDEDYKKSYYVDDTENLEANLKKVGYVPGDITDIIITHLHFDHCGGTTKINPVSKRLELSFPNAMHYISKKQWNSALFPNYREKSSYIIENFEPLKNSDNLRLIEHDTKLSNNIELRLFNGHTEGLMLPIVKVGDRTIFFAGDLIPAKASIPLAWVSAYDIFPLTSIEEKIKIFTEAIENNWILMFQHDYYNECCTLHKTHKGIRAKEIFEFNNLNL